MKNAPSLSGFLDPVCAALNEEAARKLISLKPDRKLQARVAKLADKSNEGQLTPDELTEYETYLIANHVVAVLVAKARVLLARKRQPV